MKKIGCLKNNITSKYLIVAKKKFKKIKFGVLKRKLKYLNINIKNILVYIKLTYFVSRNLKRNLLFFLQHLLKQTV